MIGVECRENCGEVDDAYFFAKTSMPCCCLAASHYTLMKDLGLDLDILHSFDLTYRLSA